RNAKVRVLRGKKALHKGVLSSLRRFEKDVREVRTGYECGVKVEGFNAVEVGDHLQFYVMERQEQT
ncbi:MAG: translation initiation factor IF-2, partial [Chloroflexota bacterium]|nr:translation initiation factor IF-2 [Chloroflexota bacterium]